MYAHPKISNIKQAVSRHGIILPKPFLVGLDALEKRYTRTPRQATEPRLVALCLAALDKKQDPIDDPAVQNHLLHHYHDGTIDDALKQGFMAAVDDLLRDQTPAIIASFKPTFTDLGAVVSEAAQQLPDVQFHRASDVLGVGSRTSNLELWGRAHDALRTLDGIEGVVRILISVSRDHALVGAPLTADQLDELAQRSLHNSMSAPALLGIPLDLTDQTGYEDRQARVAAERARVAEQRGRDGTRILRFA